MMTKKTFSNEKFRAALAAANLDVPTLYAELSRQKWRPSLATLYNWCNEGQPLNVNFLRPVAVKLGVEIDSLYQ